ncbi:MAG: hypothetical protein J6N52_01115 [Clostridia bacterium]|nr:hypothetical protein [Clostridia bacterium]
MRKIERIAAVGFLTMLCVFNTVYAVPVKEDPESETKVTVTDKAEGSETQTAKATQGSKETQTAKATQKSKATQTAKATQKTKATSTAKATSKTTASASSTSKASSSSSEKASEDADEKEAQTNTEDVIVVETTPEPLLNVQNNAEQLENKKYLTKGGAFLWFLFTVLVSAIISFAISYRFFKMGRRDNHVMAELRALKRDIDTKMVGTVGGFSEYDVNMTNSNNSYAKANSSIHSGQRAEADEQNEEIYKKWETQIQRTHENQSAERPVQRTAQRPAAPVSRTAERRRPVNKKKQGVGGKIKGVFNDIFPFDKQ